MRNGGGIPGSAGGVRGSAGEPPETRATPATATSGQGQGCTESAPPPNAISPSTRRSLAFPSARPPAAGAQAR